MAASGFYLLSYYWWVTIALGQAVGTGTLPVPSDAVYLTDDDGDRLTDDDGDRLIEG